MKHALAILMFAPMTAFASPNKLIALSCESTIGFTVDEALESGTISLTGGGSSVGVFPMTAVKKENGETLFQSSVPMISLTAKFSAPIQEDGFMGYEVEVTTQFDQDKKSESLFCVAIQP